MSDPLEVQWWVPVIAVGSTIGAVAALRRVSQRHRTGLWAGLAICETRVGGA